MDSRVEVSQSPSIETRGKVSPRILSVDTEVIMKFSVSGIQIRHAYPWPHRVLSRIFVLGGEVIVDGGCSHRPQFSRGVWGHAPPPPQIFFEF